jgi:serine/threonine protein kinase
VINKEDKDYRLQQEQTDELLPRAWKSGSLKYDELKPLSEGGTAKLFLTEDLNLHRNVAYKALHKDLQDSDIETQRFVREARVTANIQHPGTVPVYELGRDRDGQLFFTMKRVLGLDLRQILLDLKHEVPDTMERFPLPRLLDVLIQVSQTIAYAHDIGVVHRDLKPANIIIGKFGEVYVLDWGLAKVMGGKSLAKELGSNPQPGDLSLTRSGMHYGTPMYMTPEIARGLSDLDEKSDVFSLGILLFEMLTLEPFLQGNDISEIKQKLLEEPYRLPREVNPERHIPKDLQAICMKALHRSRGLRYSNATSFLEDLQRYRHGEEVSVYWYSGWERFTRWNNQNAYLIISLISGLIGAGIYALFAH